MTKPVSSSPVLPIAHVLLRILVVLNWFGAAAIVALLVVMPNREWILAAFKLDPSLEADRLIMGLRMVAVVGLATFPLNHVFLRKLQAIVETVRVGDPFVATNAARLRTIAWVLLTLQCLGVVIAVLVEGVSTPAHPIKINAGFSVNGWLAVLLTFLLARVFAEGAHMRDDLEGTV